MLLLLLLLVWGIACKRAIAGGDGAGGVNARGRDDGQPAGLFVEYIHNTRGACVYFWRYRGFDVGKKGMVRCCVEKV